MDFFKFMFYTMGDRIYSYYTFFIIYKSLFKKTYLNNIFIWPKKNTLKDTLKDLFKTHFKRLI